ncbi:hypothetical protein Aduo_002248 [Ancylostoma duodenale]
MLLMSKTAVTFCNHLVREELLKALETLAPEDAGVKATVNFCSYLVREGLLKASELRALGVIFHTSQYCDGQLRFPKFQAPSLQATVAIFDDDNLKISNYESPFKFELLNTTDDAAQRLGDASNKAVVNFCDYLVRQELLKAPKALIRETSSLRATTATTDTGPGNALALARVMPQSEPEQLFNEVLWPMLKKKVKPRSLRLLDVSE